MAVRTTTGGDLLRQWRESGLMTQVEAGEKLGINPQQISRYECGRVVPGFYIARKFLDECGIPPGLWISKKGRTL